MRLSGAVVIGVLLLAGCYKDATAPTAYTRPADVWWLEWPAQAASAAGESLRVVLSAPCGTLHLDVTSDSQRITVAATTEGDPYLRCASQLFDTVLALPDLVPPQPPTPLYPVPFLVRARIRNYVTGASELATLGTLELTAQPPAAAVRAAAGRAALGGDAGCAWVRPQGLGNDSLLIVNPPAGIAQGTEATPALVGGTFVALDPPVCGQTTGFQLSYAQLDVVP